MIDPAYVHMMARYNAWENKQLMDILNEMPVSELLLDRGAFFGSIMGTVNHLLWGDMLWLSRFDPTTPPPQCTPGDAITMYSTFAAWQAQRMSTDVLITRWADGVKPEALNGDMDWYSGAMKQDFSRPISTCIIHFFNHQTHHRGQVHAMLTATGQDAPVSDLIFMPKDM